MRAPCIKLGIANVRRWDNMQELRGVGRRVASARNAASGLGLGAFGGSAAFAPECASRLPAAQDVPTLTVAWGTDIDTLDPAQFKSDGSYIVQCNIYDTALQWDAIPVPGEPG